jgi:hypothetical protein
MEDMAPLRRSSPLEAVIDQSVKKMTSQYAQPVPAEVASPTPVA